MLSPVFMTQVHFLINYLCDIIKVLRSRRLRCFGHVERAPSASCIKMASEMKISYIKRRGRPRKNWLDCVKNDIKERCLTHTDPQDRILREPQFDNAWCCRPHLMGHHNQKLDMMMNNFYRITESFHSFI